MVQGYFLAACDKVAFLRLEPVAAIKSSPMRTFASIRCFGWVRARFGPRTPLSSCHGGLGGLGPRFFGGDVVVATGVGARSGSSMLACRDEDGGGMGVSAFAGTVC